jgi:hypothetical protein
VSQMPVRRRSSPVVEDGARPTEAAMREEVEAWPKGAPPPEGLGGEGGERCGSTT